MSKSSPPEERYSAFGPDFSSSRRSAEALATELRIKRVDLRQVTITFHGRMGDRSGPVSHFPELGLGPSDTPPEDLRYRTLWLRFCAGIIDLIVVAPFLGILLFAPPAAFSWQEWWLTFAIFVVNAGYFITCHARTGRTLGKSAMGVTVVDATSEACISWQHSVRRESPLVAINLALLAIEAAIVLVRPENAGPLLAGSLLLFRSFPNLWFVADVLTAVAHPKRRSLHDIIGRTVVVRGSARAQPPALPASSSAS